MFGEDIRSSVPEHSHQRAVGTFRRLSRLGIIGRAGAISLAGVGCKEPAGKRDYRDVRTARGLFVGCKYCIACCSYRQRQGRSQHGHAAMHRHIPPGRESDKVMASYRGPSRFGNRDMLSSIQADACRRRGHARQVGDRGVHNNAYPCLATGHGLGRKVRSCKRHQ